MASTPSTSDDAVSVEPVPSPDAPDAPGDTDASVEDATGGREPYSPPESSAGTSETDEPVSQEMPVFVISCPNCNSTFPWTAELEGYEPSTSSHFHKCNECDGMGMVLTGSHVLAHSTIECPECKGLGYGADNPALIATPEATMQPPWEGAKWNAELKTWT